VGLNSAHLRSQIVFSIGRTSVWQIGRLWGRGTGLALQTAGSTRGAGVGFPPGQEIRALVGDENSLPYQAAPAVQVPTWGGWGPDAGDV